MVKLGKSLELCCLCVMHGATSSYDILQMIDHLSNKTWENYILGYPRNERMVVLGMSGL